jgi:hypothetical protein
VGTLTHSVTFGLFPERERDIAVTDTRVFKGIGNVLFLKLVANT